MILISLVLCSDCLQRHQKVSSKKTFFSNKQTRNAFEKDQKTKQTSYYPKLWRCKFLIRVQNNLRCTFLHVFARFYTWDARFLINKYFRCTFLYLRYMDTCYKVLTFNSTDFLFLNTALHCITYHWPYNTQFSKKRASQGLTVLQFIGHPSPLLTQNNY